MRVALKKCGNRLLPQGNTGSECTHVGRRAFLSMSGIVAVSAGGYAAETAGATTSVDELGYGIQSYGAAGYGGETTS